MFNPEQKHWLVKFKIYVFLIWYNRHTTFDRCDQDKLKGTNEAVLPKSQAFRSLCNHAGC